MLGSLSFEPGKRKALPNLFASLIFCFNSADLTIKLNNQRSKNQ